MLLFHSSPLIEPEVSNQPHVESPLPLHPPSGLSSGCRRYFDREARMRIRKDVRFCPNPKDSRMPIHDWSRAEASTPSIPARCPMTISFATAARTVLRGLSRPAS